MIWFKAVKDRNGTLTFLTTNNVTRDSGHGSFKIVTIRSDKTLSYYARDDRLNMPQVIHDIGKDFEVGPDVITVKQTAYKLPQPDIVLLRKLRPKMMNSKIEQKIGPYWIEDNKVWFGTSFYDGELYTGIGGVGYFDLEADEYHIDYHRELAKWSTSAIYKDGDDIYLGLKMEPEAEAVPGGLVRYDRKKQNR